MAGALEGRGLEKAERARVPEPARGVLEIAEAAPGVWWSKSDERTDRPVLGAIVGEERTLMVDAGASGAHALAFIEALERATGRRPDLVALTHWHWDHVFGLAALGLPSIAHEATAERLGWMRGLAWDEAAVAARVKAGEEIAFCETMIRAEYGADRDIRIGTATVVFEERLTLELGRRSVMLERIANDHSADGVVILDEKARVAFLGDIAGPDYYAKPVRYRPARALALFSRLSALPAGILIQGHGEPETPSAFLKSCAAIVAIARAVLEGERDRASLAAIAADAAPDEEGAEIHRLVAFMLKGADEK